MCVSLLLSFTNTNVVYILNFFLISARLMPVCQLWGIYHHSKIGKLEKVTKPRVVSFGKGGEAKRKS